MTDTATVDDVVDAQPEARSCSFEYEIRSDTAAGLTFDGYAAVFGAPALVHDYRGSYMETVVPGAFKRTLAARKPLVLFEHGGHPLIGTMPIANLHRIAEDSRGVHVRGMVFSNWLTTPITDGMRAGEITGMSYNFEAVQESWSPDRSTRSIHELKLLMLGDDRASEISITAAPVQPAAQLSIRSILALRHLVEGDDEIRAALESALGASAATTTDPTPDHSVIPEETLAIWARVISRRRAA